MHNEKQTNKINNNQTKKMKNDTSTLMMKLGLRRVDLLETESDANIFWNKGRLDLIR